MPLKIAVLLGDELQPQFERLAAQGIREMFSGEPLPPACVSISAYLGAPGIVEALRLGADVVITGRVVDSVVVRQLQVTRSDQMKKRQVLLRVEMTH